MASENTHIYLADRISKSGFGLPLPGLPVDFATDPLAIPWSDGTLAVRDHPLGNIIEFYGPKSIPNDLSLSWREWITCLHTSFQVIVHLEFQSKNHAFDTEDYIFSL